MVKIDHPPFYPNASVNPLFFYLDPESTILRIYKNKRQPIDFNSNGPRGRFDHHVAGTLENPKDDSDRSVYYAAPVITSELDALGCCIAEIFGDPIAIENTEMKVRIMDNISERSICSINITRQLKLLDLRGNGSMRVGLVTAISAIPDRESTQLWSRYFYDNEILFSRIDGIIYLSSHNEQPSIMLYERAKDALKLNEDLKLNDFRLSAQIQEIARELMIAIRPEEWL